MKLSQFRFNIKLQVPGITNTGISDSDLDNLINEGVDDANLLTKVYKGYTDFTLEADTFIFALSEKVPLWLGADKGGLWIQDANGVLKRIFPKTPEWLNQRIENWRSASSGSQSQYYATDGDDLIIYPPLNEDRAARIYHLKKATPMDNDDNYPWTNTATEITALRPMDDAVIAYVRWKMKNALGKDQAGGLTMEEYHLEASKRAKQVRRRPDLTTDSQYGMHTS